MIYLSAQDFFEKASLCRELTRQEEIEYGHRMNNGDAAARDALIESYTPIVARHIRHTKAHLQTLGLVLYCMQALEKAVDSFDFTQDSEPFSHRLSWAIRQAVARYLVR